MSDKIIYYASIIGKLPRKRKEQRFECRLDSNTTEEAVQKLTILIATHNIKHVRNAQLAPYTCSELDFTDSNGIKQVIVMRGMFPSGQAVEVEVKS